MNVQTECLIVRFDPDIGGIVRAILTKHANLIASKKQYQEGQKVCIIITPAPPDTDDDEEQMRFIYLFFDQLPRELEVKGVLVEKRKKVA